MSADPQSAQYQAEHWFQRPVLDRAASSQSLLEISRFTMSLHQQFNLDHKAVDDPPTSATIKSLVDEPMFMPVYMSEEEDVSSPDNDGMSFGSTSATDEDMDDFDATFPEILAESCTFVGQHARTISLVSPGKPKIIQLVKPSSPRSPRTPTVTTPTARRPTQHEPVRTPLSKFHRRSMSSLSLLTGRSSTSFDKSRCPTPSLTATPSTPALDFMGSTPASAYSPLTPTSTKSTFDADLSPSIALGSNGANPRPKNPYRLRLFPKRMASSNELARNSMSQVVLPSQPLSAPLDAPSVYSKQQKLVPRPANERTDSFVLPPFQEKEKVVYTIMKENVASVPARKSVSGRERIRRMKSGFALNER